MYLSSCANRIVGLSIWIVWLTLGNLPAASAQTTTLADPQVLEEIGQSLETLQADPGSLDPIRTWIEEREDELVRQQEQAQQDWERLQQELETAQRDREQLHSRLNALNVALILLEEGSGSEEIPALAQTPESDAPEGDE